MGPAGIKRVDDYLLRPFYLRPTKRTSLTLRVLELKVDRLAKLHPQIFPVFQFNSINLEIYIGFRHCYLPRCQARRTEQMSARFYPHVLVVFRAYFTQLKRASHLAIQFVLFGGDFYVFFGGRLHRPCQIWVQVSTVRVQVAGTQLDLLRINSTWNDFAATISLLTSLPGIRLGVLG